MGVFGDTETAKYNVAWKAYTQVVCKLLMYINGLSPIKMDISNLYKKEEEKKIRFLTYGKLQVVWVPKELFGCCFQNNLEKFSQ